MPTFLAVVLTIAAVITAVGVIVGAARRFVLVPLRDALRELRQFRGEVQQADSIAAELRAVAGSVTTLAVALMGERSDDRRRVDDVAELVTELTADVARVMRDVQRLSVRVDHYHPPTD